MYFKQLSFVLLLTLGLYSIVSADDLNPVKFKTPPSHIPISLVENGKAKTGISVMVPKSEISGVLGQAIRDLQRYIKLSTGAELPIEYGRTDGQAIIIGNCELAKRNGLVGENMPVEGFAIKTCTQGVLIIGNDGIIVPGTQSDGTAWGIYEFLERFVGIRWYFPGDIGCSVPAIKNLIIPPIYLEDAPFFRKRSIYPPCGEPSHGKGTQLTPHHNRLRAGDSWPIHLVVHAPHNWKPEYGEKRPEIFQLRSDGERNYSMLCYGNPLTLKTYLENIENYYEQRKRTKLGIVGNAITVSPNDMEVSCHCEYCRKLWDENGGQYGSASKVVGQFVANLAREVKKRWPDKVIIYLPYKNYTIPPKEIPFPDNVYIQLCGMPGLAQYKEPSIAESEQYNIDEWIRLTGHKIQNWHYICWPADKTKACYLFPHTIKEFYRRNKDKIVGSFINGVKDHWPRQHISLYIWLKVLWNPDFDVDAAISEYCRRMYGPAAKTMHKLIKMQIDGWEKSRWQNGKFSPKSVYEYSYPRKDAVLMEKLLNKSIEEAKGNELVMQRLEYYAEPLKAFFQESKEFAEGTGRLPLIAQKMGENPIIDGKLDDKVWQYAQAVSFIRAMDKEQKQPQFPTELKAVWTFDGISFGFKMEEPTPEKLSRDIKGRDDSLAWWNDNVEIFLDVTGKRTGYYQFIINPNGAVFDSEGKNTQWTCKELKTKAFTGKDFWSLEVFIPYSAFKDAVIPTTGVVWYGNFTRHRVCDGKPREYQRLNTTYQPSSNNMMAFGPIKFVE
jgi:hypothetical protein